MNRIGELFVDIDKAAMEEDFQSLITEIGPIGAEIITRLKGCEEAETMVMKYLYTAMPRSDAANYSFDIYLDYARHGIFLWENSCYAKGMPPFIFRNYVLHHRVNEEEVVPCRRLFYQKVSQAVEDSTLEKAILDLNYWCAGEVTYHSTDDRCASPLSIYYSGVGRCGEESTFVVHVLRSAGIPARQIYAPRWAHCDDNHAWVEVYLAGDWKFLGACEPEEELNRGWFVGAAARAPLVHSRLFLPRHWQGKIVGEEEIGRQGCVTLLNQTSRYAETGRVEITVTDQPGRPLSGVDVSFQVYNYAAFAEIARIKTDSTGKVSLCLGQGMVRAAAACHGLYGEQEIIVAGGTQSILILSERESAGDIKKSPSIIKEVDFVAPGDRPRLVDDFAKPPKAPDRERLAQAYAHRSRKEEGVISQAERESMAALFESGESRQAFIQMLPHCRGNWPEWKKFFNPTDSPERRERKRELLALLPVKDLQDFQAAVLEEHLNHTERTGLFSQKEILADEEGNESHPEITAINYRSNILSPRIWWEPLRTFRDELETCLSPEQTAVFRANPEKIRIWLDELIATEESRESPALVTFPEKCIKLQKAGALSKAILLTALCRTLGIPARLNPTDGSPEYGQTGRFHAAGAPHRAMAELTLHFPPGPAFQYGENWSLSVFDQSREGWRRLELFGEKPDREGKITLYLPRGDYRLITGNRLPNGNVRVWQQDFTLWAAASFPVGFRKVSPADMLMDILLPDFEITSKESGKETTAKQLMKNTRCLFIWLDDGKEPTEHILNELCDQREALRDFPLKMIYLLPTDQTVFSETLKKNLAAFPEAELYYSRQEDTSARMARRMYTEPGKLPLIILTDENGKGIYSTAGYQVGTGGMLVKLLSLE